MTTQTTQRPPARKAKSEEKAAKKAVKKGTLSASTADRHELYQLSVQDTEAEINFVDETFEEIRGREARLLREDFCGTGNTSCEWVRRRADNRAIGLDIDGPTLAWGVEHCVSTLTDDERERVTLIERDVLAPGDATDVDCVLAMNFSYWLFQTRDELRRYFEGVRASLADGGVFFLDHYGGSESMTEQQEKKKVEDGRGREFTYIWDQKSFNPITGTMACRIHFKFPDKTKWMNAFEYEWRLWTLPEIRELLSEAGFSQVHVYWEGEDEDGEGNGEFERTLEGTADPAFISYIVAYD